MPLPRITEVIVVEGRDDTAAVNRAVEAVTIETHGFGISAATWARLRAAYERNGLIVLTDPDYAGERIRQAILKEFPGAGQAHIPMGEASKDGDIGVENAPPEVIAEALRKARYAAAPGRPPGDFTMEDLKAAGLSGEAGSAARREKLGAALGIGYGNAGALLRKLNGLGITRSDFDRAVAGLGDTDEDDR